MDHAAAPVGINAPVCLRIPRLVRDEEVGARRRARDPCVALVGVGREPEGSGRPLHRVIVRSGKASSALIGMIGFRF